MREQVVQWLCDWFTSRRKFKGDFSSFENTNYLETGLLTSLEVVEFVSEIESHFDVQFSENDFQDPRFATVTGLAELVANRSAEAAERR